MRGAIQVLEIEYAARVDPGEPDGDNSQGIGPAKQYNHKFSGLCSAEGRGICRDRRRRGDTRHNHAAQAQPGRQRNITR